MIFLFDDLGTTYLDAKTNKELTEFALTNTKIIDSSENWNLYYFKKKHYTLKDANPC